MANHSKHLKTVQSTGRITLTIAAIIYVAWTLGTSVNRNYKTNQVIDQLKASIAKLKLSIADEKDLLVYYQSQSYQEIQARRDLGAIAPGEKVIILPKDLAANNSQPEDMDGQLTGSQVNRVDSSSNMSKWWKFIFS